MKHFVAILAPLFCAGCGGYQHPPMDLTPEQTVVVPVSALRRGQTLLAVAGSKRYYGRLAAARPDTLVVTLSGRDTALVLGTIDSLWIRRDGGEAGFLLFGGVFSTALVIAAASYEGEGPSRFGPAAILLAGAFGFTVFGTIGGMMTSTAVTWQRVLPR